MQKFFTLCLVIFSIFLTSFCEKSKNPLQSTGDKNTITKPDTSVIIPDDSPPVENNEYTIIENFNIKDIQQTADGGYLAIDNISDRNLNILKKIDINYQQVWTHELNLPVNNNDYWPAAITILSDNSIIAATSSDSTIFCAKLDGNGNVLWNKEYAINGESSYIADIQCISENEILLFGQVDAIACHPTEPGYCYKNFNQSLLFAIDYEGEKQWSNYVYKWDGDVYYHESFFKSDSGFVLINGSYDGFILLVNTDNLGNFISYTYLGNTLDFAFYSDQLGLILGANLHNGPATNNFELQLIDQSGNIVWETEATPQFEGSDAFIDNHGDIIVLGDYVGCDDPGLCNRKDYKIWLAKYNSSGQQIASWIYNDMEYTEGIKFFLNPDGSYTVIGKELSKANYNFIKDYFFMRVDASVLDGTSTGIEE